MSVGMDDFRRSVIGVGVTVLRQSGFPGVTMENILSKPEYRTAFLRVLEESNKKSKGADMHLVLLLNELRRMEGISTS